MKWIMTIIIIVYQVNAIQLMTYINTYIFAIFFIQCLLYNILQINFAQKSSMHNICGSVSLKSAYGGTVGGYDTGIFSDI